MKESPRQTDRLGSSSGPSGRASILIIDDVRDTADSLAVFLRARYGYEVRVATDGETGLKWAQADRPDAVVCDAGMPGLDGLQVARQIRDTVSPPPLLIAVTGYSGIYPENAALGPFDHYLVKPTDPNEIARLLAQLGR